MSIISEIINPFLTVRKQIKDRGQWIDEEVKREQIFSRGSYATTIAPEDYVTVIESFNRKVIIDVIEYGSMNDDTGIYPKLHINSSTSATDNYGNEILHSIFGGLRALPSYRWLALNFNSHLIYDGDADSYETGNHNVRNRKQIILPEGCRLTFHNAGETEQMIRYKVVWREIDI